MMNRRQYIFSVSLGGSLEIQRENTLKWDREIITKLIVQFRSGLKTRPGQLHADSLVYSRLSRNGREWGRVYNSVFSRHQTFMKR